MQSVTKNEQSVLLGANITCHRHNSSRDQGANQGASNDFKGDNAVS